MSLSTELAEYLSALKSNGISLKTADNYEKIVDESEKRKEAKKRWRIREELGHIWIQGKHTQIVRKFLELKGF